MIGAIDIAALVVAFALSVWLWALALRDNRRSTLRAVLVNRRSYDGMRMGGADGRLFVVHEPALWQLRRWLVWWRSSERGTATLSAVTSRGRTSVDVRLLPTSERLPRVPVHVNGRSA